MDFGILQSILVVLVIALCVTVVFRQLHLPVILGYLIVGVLVGPHVFGWLPSVKDIDRLAEFGVVFLMFTIGLEFSLSRFFALKRPVLILGGLQVIFTIIITTVIGVSFDMSLLSAFIVGGIVAMSSTAIVMKQLSEQLEINSQHGLNAIGILLFQDLTVIPFLILIASSVSVTHSSALTILLWSVAKGLIAIVLIFAIGRWLLRPLFRLTSATRMPELFTLNVLLVTLAAAWLTHILGLSYALGAFLAGMMLGETEFRQKIEIEIRPFRDILLGLFFITVGMLLNVSTWQTTWIWIVLLLAAILLGKSVLIMLLSRIFGYSNSTSFRTGLVLAQGGEFGFAILSLALSYKLLSDDYGQVILGALLLSFAIAPLLIHYNKLLAKKIFPREFKNKRFKNHIKNPVIICGYGRIGQNIARLLKEEQIEYVGVDTDPELIGNAKLAGEPVKLGDATEVTLLESIHLAKAKAVLINFDDTKSVIKTLHNIRQKNYHVPILVRAKDDAQLEQLQGHGATHIITETFEASLIMGYHLLMQLKISHRKASSLIQSIRQSRYELLRKVFPGSYSYEYEEMGFSHEQLRPVLLTPSAFAVGKTISDTSIKTSGIEVILLRRDDTHHANPRGNMKLKANDIVVLYGPITHLEAAERKLLIGINPKHKV